jgi:chaperonin GroEL
MIEKRHRIEDALEAVKSAQAEGVLPGGGSFLTQKSLELSELLSEKIENETQQLGVQIIQKSLKEPLRQMCLNAGESPDLIIAEVLSQKKNFGYDFSEQKMVNLLERGVIDPARVTRCALQNSVSVAGTLITSNFAIIEV